MNLLFVHDHKFKYKNSLVYSNGSFPSAVWGRYQSFSDKLTVVGRYGGELCSVDNNLSVSSTKGVEFNLLPNTSNLKGLLLPNKVVTESCRSLVAENDAIIARLPSRLGHLFVAEAVKQGKPYAVEVVGCPFDALWNHGSWKGKLLAPFASSQLKKTTANAPFALYVTKYFLQKKYPCSGKRVFCSNVEIGAVPNKVINLRLERIESGSSTIKFGLIGNYSSDYKGIDIAIRALASCDSLNNWQFDVVGFGDSYKYQKLARELGVEEKVNFVGSLASGSAIFDWLDTVDVYLQPSLTEGLPRALVEAMSRGCPALGTTVGGIPELLNAEELVEPGDSITLRRNIERVINNGKLKDLAKENFNKAKGYYTELLSERRHAFWSDFRTYVDKGINEKI